MYHSREYAGNLYLPPQFCHANYCIFFKKYKILLKINKNYKLIILLLYCLYSTGNNLSNRNGGIHTYKELYTNAHCIFVWNSSNIGTAQFVTILINFGGGGAIQWNSIQKKMERTIYTITWMNLKIIMPSEWSQTEKEYIFYYSIYKNFYKMKINLQRHQADKRRSVVYLECESKNNLKDGLKKPQRYILNCCYVHYLDCGCGLMSE